MPPLGPTEWLRRVAGPVEQLTPLSGGDTHAAWRATIDGQRLFVKHSAVAHPFAAEAAALQAIRGSPTSLLAPEPLAWDDHHLLTTWLTPGPARPDEDLGIALAEMHRHSAPAFGFPIDSSCGATPLANPWTDDWPTFFVNHRLRPLLDRLRPTSQERPVWEALLDLLPDLVATHEAPALVHGDLWSGNHLHTKHGHAVIDPSAAFAHREFELGMMTLFGGFGPDVYRSYRQAWPLPRGAARRVAAYRLFHVWNHAVLFGGSYRLQGFRLARRILEDQVEPLP